MLDTDSRLEFSFAQATRHLRLAKGRVRLSVTNNEQPLRVEAGGGVVTAEDAAFDIGFEENGALSVTVLRGEADIRFGDAPETGNPRAQVLPSGRSVTRSEEHTSELQSLLRISYAVFCFKKKTIHKHK